MADGDHYASYANVRDILNNQNIGVTTLYSEDSLEAALDFSMAMIHNYLGIRNMTKLTNAVDIIILAAIQCDLIVMRILQSKHINESNLADAGTVSTFWSTVPSLTFFHMSQLDRLDLELNGVAYSFDVRTGRQIS